MNILITSGGTAVPIDAVRYIANFSGGRFMSELAREFMKFGHDVHFLTSKKGRKPLSNRFDWRNIFLNKYYNETEYFTYQEYEEAFLRLLENQKFDMVVCGAAVSDFVLAHPILGKIESSDKDLLLKLKPTKKLIKEVKKIQPNTKLIGCKLLVGSRGNELELACSRSINVNKCDIVIGNDLTTLSNDHDVAIYTKKGVKIHYSAKKEVGAIAKFLLL